MTIYEVVCDLTNEVQEYSTKSEAMKALRELKKGFIIKVDEENDIQDIIASK